MTKTIFIELENVLASTQHRQHLSHNYEDFERAADDDVADKTIVELLAVLSEVYEIVVFSISRKERQRYQTMEWLTDNEVACEHLLLRGDNDYSNGVELRYDFVIEHFNGDEEKALERTFCVLTNFEKSVELFRENGFKVLTTEW